MQTRTWKGKKRTWKKPRRSRLCAEISRERENAREGIREFNLKAEGVNCESKGRFSGERKALLKHEAVAGSFAVGNWEGD
jgi:hypothetical protein